MLTVKFFCILPAVLSAMGSIQNNQPNSTEMCLCSITFLLYDETQFFFFVACMISCTKPNKYCVYIMFGRLKENALYL
jgi:hypothetical protein